MRKAAVALVIVSAAIVGTVVPFWLLGAVFNDAGVSLWVLVK